MFGILKGFCILSILSFQRLWTNFSLRLENDQIQSLPWCECRAGLVQVSADWIHVLVGWAFTLHKLESSSHSGLPGKKRKEFSTEGVHLSETSNPYNPSSPSAFASASCYLLRYIKCLFMLLTEATFFPPVALPEIYLPGITCRPNV